MTNAVTKPRGAAATTATDKVASPRAGRSAERERGWRARGRGWLGVLVERSHHRYARGQSSAEGETSVRCPQCNRLFSEGERTCPHDGAALVSLDALVGSEVDGRYRITGRIGQGGMGTVYRAIQLSVGRDVAIKVLSAEVSQKPEVVARFETEARVISRLQHPCTLKLFDFGRLPDGRLFLVTELLEGRSLGDALKHGPLPAERVINVLDQICRALAEAHDLGVVHRDLKPDNIFMQNVGAEEVIKVLDFGIAKVATESTMAAHRTATGKIYGTPWYMSPEQARGGPIDGRGDLYSLGVVAYECLTGRVPFQEAEPWAVIMKHVMEDPRPPCELRPGCATPELQALVLDLLEKLPEDRPQSAEAVRLRLASMSHRAPLATSELDATVPATPIDEAREAELAARGNVEARPLPVTTLLPAGPERGPEVRPEVRPDRRPPTPTPAPAPPSTPEDALPIDGEPVATRDLLPGHGRTAQRVAGGLGALVLLGVIVLLLLPTSCPPPRPPEADAGPADVPPRPPPPTPEGGTRRRCVPPHLTVAGLSATPKVGDEATLSVKPAGAQLSATPGVCSRDGDVVKLDARGQCTIEACLPADCCATKVIPVSAAPRCVRPKLDLLGLPPVPKVGDRVTLSVKPASAHLSASPRVCSLRGNVVKLGAQGRCAIRACLAAGCCATKVIPVSAACVRPHLVLRGLSSFPEVGDTATYTVKPANARLSPNGCFERAGASLKFTTEGECTVKACLAPHCCGKVVVNLTASE